MQNKLLSSGMIFRMKEEAYVTNELGTVILESVDKGKAETEVVEYYKRLYDPLPIEITFDQARDGTKFRIYRIRKGPWPTRGIS